MGIDNFRGLTDEESKKKVDEWFFDLEYMEKLRILLRVYEKLNITKIESLSINSLWRKISLENQKDIYQRAWQFQR